MESWMNEKIATGIDINRQRSRVKVNARMNPEAIRAYRKSRRESQLMFWLRFGVTQSRGSRFEAGTDIPSPIATLLRLYLEGIVTDFDLRQP
jgi:DNA-binding transcriptional regulator YiaG